MDKRGRKLPSRRGLLPRLALLAACLAHAGCVGPAAIRSTRMRYNEVVRATNDEQLLMNLVRLRYADSPIFIDLPNITSQFEVAGGTSYPGRGAASTSLGVVGLSGRDTPTLSYAPRQGREIAKALLNPLSADLLSVVNAGARLEQFLWMTLNDINDVQNAVRATTLAPRVPDDNTVFLRGVHLLAEIDDLGGTEIGFSTSEDPSNASVPIAEGLVTGGDLLAAAKGDYVYRARGAGQVALIKRDREPILKVRARFTHSPQMEELARIFHLTPGLSHYKIRSELQPDAESSPPTALGGAGASAGNGNDTIYLNLRSILQIMTFLAKGVCVPVEHVVDGTAPTTFDADGLAFDWTRVTAGNFFVASSTHRPRDAEVAVFYRGYWFFIPRGDVNSRSVLAVLEILFSLQESEGHSGGPVLTLPVSR